MFTRNIPAHVQLQGLFVINEQEESLTRTIFPYRPEPIGEQFLDKP